jgi:hypothetical protein
LNNIKLEFCKRTDVRYQQIRDRHYVKNNGVQGQQIHFLIHYNNQIVGIISGASSVYGVQCRDDFFKIPHDKNLKQHYYLPAIINNVVFRLECHEKNLATQILAKFRKIICQLWEEIYDVPVIGFETFVVETDFRKGALYKADNWTYVGQTKGNAKKHTGWENKHHRTQTNIKLCFCRWIKEPVIPTKKYISSWKCSTQEEIDRNKKLKIKKEKLIGQMF